MDLDKKSRLLIKALRHQPEVLELKLDDRGWVTISSVMKSLKVTKDDLDYIVSSNNKKRFEYDDRELKIRASQGHSIKDIEVYKDWSIFTPTGPVYHGTPDFAVSLIMKSKLVSKSRTHVHLSKDIQTAYTVGRRHGVPIILEIDAVSMLKDGFKFYESKNGVILIDEVPSKYITLLIKVS
jgi:putative RNA 2'-phosphotransferase